MMTGLMQIPLTYTLWGGATKQDILWKPPSVSIVRYLQFDCSIANRAEEENIVVLS